MDCKLPQPLNVLVLFVDKFLHLSELVDIKPLDGLVALLSDLLAVIGDIVGYLLVFDDGQFLAETNLFPPWRDIPKRKKKVAKSHNQDFMEKIAYFMTIGKKGEGGTKK